MNSVVIDHWKRLIFPPDTVTPVLFEQREPGGQVVPCNPADVLWKKHLSGFATYLVELAWTDPASAGSKVRAGVLELPAIDAEALAATEPLHKAAAESGLSVAFQWSAAGKVLLWVFSESVAAETMAAALARLATQRPGARPLSLVLPAPGWDRAARGWTYFFRADERPTPVDSEVIPGGLLEYQTSILSEIVPTTADRLSSFAGNRPATIPDRVTTAIRPTNPPLESARTPASSTVRACEVLSDPGQPIRLMVRRADGAWEMVRMDAPAALDLARDLIEAALRRLNA